MRVCRSSLVSIALFLASTLTSVPRVAHAVGAAPGAATPVQREQAQQKFLRGRDAFALKDWPKAIELLRASMDIVQSPNTRLYLARALRESGKLVEAYVEFGRTAVEAEELAAQDPRYNKTGPAAKLERAQLEAKLAFVHVSIAHPSDQTRLTVGGEEVRRAGWDEPLPALPGTLDVVVDTPNRPTRRETLTLAAGDRREVAIDAGATVDAPAAVAPVAAPSSGARGSSPLRTWAWISSGVGVAGLATFATFGLLSKQKFDQLAAVCTPTCPASRQSDVSTGKTEQTVANVALVVGALGAATGITLFIVSSGKSSETHVSFTPSGLIVEGSF
jgi:hypothetical protein